MDEWAGQCERKQRLCEEPQTCWAIIFNSGCLLGNLTVMKHEWGGGNYVQEHQAVLCPSHPHISYKHYTYPEEKREIQKKKEKDVMWTTRAR